MTNLATATDSEDIDEREQAFYGAGLLLGLLKAGRDVSEVENLQHEPPSTEWAHEVVAMGLLCAAIAYCVDIAVDLERDYLDEGQLGDHISYLIDDSVVSGLNDDHVGFALARDEAWAQSNYDLVLSRHWNAVAALAEMLLADGVSDEVATQTLSQESVSHFVA